jgi:hypothetical protein
VSREKRESKGRVRVEGLQGTFDCMQVSYASLDGMRNAVTHLLTVPLPPVRTVPAIFCNFSTFILQIQAIHRLLELNISSNIRCSNCCHKQHLYQKSSPRAPPDGCWD